MNESINQNHHPPNSRKISFPLYRRTREARQVLAS
jgi:hypothetical protein